MTQDVLGETVSKNTPEIFESVVLIPLSQIELGPNLSRFAPGENEAHKKNIQAIADSIQQDGQQSPIWVEEVGEGKYRTLFGETRYRAVQLINEREKNDANPEIHLTKLKCIVKNGLSQEDKVNQAVIENHLHSELTPMDRAHSYRNMSQQGKNQREIAESLGISQSLVSQYLSLFLLPQNIQSQVNRGLISFADAAALARRSEEERDTVLADATKQSRTERPKASNGTSESGPKEVKVTRRMVRNARDKAEGKYPKISKGKLEEIFEPYYGSPACRQGMSYICGCITLWLAGKLGSTEEANDVGLILAIEHGCAEKMVHWSKDVSILEELILKQAKVKSRDRAEKAA